MRLRRRKHALCLALLLLLTLPLLTPAGAEGVTGEAVTQTLLLDGAEVQIPGVRIEGKTYTRLRTLAALLADTGSRFSLSWDGAERSIFLTSGERPEADSPVPFAGTVTESDWRLVVDGVTVSVQGYIVDGYNYYRLADLTSCLGFALDYSAAARSLVLLTEPEAEAAKAVTVMVYMVGSDLEPRSAAGTLDMAEMAASGVDLSRVNVLVYTGGATDWQSDVPKDANALFRLTEEGFQQVKTFPLQSMGKAENLSRFVNYSRRKFPADSWHLILWDHGNGPVLGCGVDRLFGGDSLTLPELAAALEATGFGGEEKLGVLGFDACLMASAELACVSAPYAEYLVASQETEPAYGWDYAFLRDCGRVSARELAEEIADSYEAYYENYRAKKPNFRGATTLSVTDLGQVPALEDALNALFLRASADVDEAYSRLAAARYRTHSLGRASTGSEYDLADLGDLAAQLAESYPAEAGALTAALDRAVVHQVSNQPDCSGLSLYYPCYNKLTYATSWEARYRELGLLPGYQAYLEQYGAKWSGTELSACFPETMTLREGAEPGTYVLDLTADQAPLVAECRYYILERGSYLSRYPNAYSAVYSSGDVTKEGQTLTARFDGNVIYCENDFGDRGLLSLRMTERREGTTEYRATCTLKTGPYADPEDSLECWLLFSADNETGELSLRELYAQDGEDLQSGKRQELDLGDYTTVNFYHKSPRTLSRDPQGRLLDYWSWPHSGLYVWYVLPTADGVGFCYAPLAEPDCEYWLLLEFTDVQGNLHTAEPFPLPQAAPEPAAEEVPEREITWDGGSSCLLLDREDFTLRLLAALDPETGEPFRAVEAVNRSAHDLSISLSYPGPEGEKRLDLMPEAGETLYYTLEGLTGESPRFRVKATDWFTGATLIRALDLALTLEAAPEPEVIRLPALGATAREQWIYEEEDFRVGIAGLGFFLYGERSLQGPGWDFRLFTPLVTLENDGPEIREVLFQRVEINGISFPCWQLFPWGIEPGERAELDYALSIYRSYLEEAGIERIESCTVYLQVDGRDLACPVALDP